MISIYVFSYLKSLPTLKLQVQSKSFKAIECLFKNKTLVGTNFFENFFHTKQGRAIIIPPLDM